jgi:cobalt/nickel transport system permease protein
MNHKLSERLILINYFEKASDQETWMVKMNPICKVILTILFLVILMSFPKYEILGTAGMILYPSVLFAMEHTSIKKIVKTLGPIWLIFILFGLVNVVIDKEMISVPIIGRMPGGVASCITLVLKGILASAASFILVSTTKVEDICFSLQVMKVPKIICIQMMLMFRYLSVILKEAESMNEAYHLRAPGQKGIDRRAWGSFLGKLLIRSIDKAELIYESMMLRGFRGEFRLEKNKKIKKKELAYLLLWTGILFLWRCCIL